MDRVILHTDGGSRGNPGPAAIGVVLFDEHDKELQTFSECIGDATNNVAEYKALIKGLALAAELTTHEVQVFMDSELIVRQMIGQYQVKTPSMVPLFQEAHARAKVFRTVTYTHVPRSHARQTRADALVNQALDNQ